MTNLKEGIRYNKENCLFLSGNGKTIGSRALFIDPDTGNPIIKKLISEDIWQATSFEFGPDTVWIGKAAGLAAAGHHLLTENIDGEFHLIPHSDFDGEVSQSDTRTLFSYFSLNNQVGQPDDSGEWTGQSIGWLGQSTVHGFVRKGYFKTGSTAATKPIRLKTYEGTDENGKLVFDQTYPASQFPASSTVEVIESGYTELTPGLDFYMTMSSDEDFSLLTDSAGVNPWAGYDVSLLRYDNFLQTAEWIDGATYTKDESWFIDGRKIYVCNITGVQTGTFAENSDKWHSIDERYGDNYTTGWLEGGQISINSGDNTKIDVTAGSVLITDYTDQMHPVINTISWDSQTALDPGLSSRSTWIGVKDDGAGDAEFVYDESFDSVERRSSAILGRIWDSGGTGPQITNVGDYERPAWGLLTAFQDFILEHGSWNISGNLYAPNGANLLLNKTSGKSYRYHAEDTIGQENVHTDAAQTPRNSYSYHLQGVSITTTETDIDPDYYDNEGVKTAVPSNKWTLQEVWFFPVSGTCHVLYGQVYYQSMVDAIEAISTETKVKNNGILNGAIKRCYLVLMQGVTDLSDSSKAAFRNAGNGAGGGPGSTYWNRTGTSLSPSVAGDDILLKTGESLSITDMVQGSIPFIGSSGLFTQNNTKLFWDENNDRLGLGLNVPARTLHIQDRNATLRIDRDTNSPAVQLHRFPSGDFTTPWKGFMFRVDADGADDGTFTIIDYHQNVSGGGDARLTIDTDGKIDIPGALDIGGIISGDGSGLTSINYTETDPVFLAQKGALNGVATLDGGGKIPVSQLPSSVMEYKGAWNASTNTPTLIDGTGDNGDVYKCSVAGTQDFGSGDITFNVSDWVVYNGSIWERSPNSDVETDPIFMAWDRSTGISITESQISDLNHFSGAIADLTGAGPLQFPSATGQKINLYADTYALGVESGQLRIASNQDISFCTGGYSGGDERALLSEAGTFKVPYRIQSPIFYHPDGILKIQPYANADVEIFGDTNVANNENSKILKMWRKASEGNDYIRFYISANRTAYIHSSNVLTLQAQNPFIINSVTQDITFKVGDSDGAKKFYFKDSDNNTVATIDSNGVLTLDINNGAYLNLVRGTVNKINNFFDSTYTDLRFEGEKDFNRIGTWIDKPFQIVTNSIERIIVDKYGRVEITNALTVDNDITVNDDIMVYGDLFARNHIVDRAVVFQDNSTQTEAGERHFAQGHTHTAVYNNDWYDTSSENISERDLHFSPDGLMLYIIGLASGGVGDCSIWEYALTIPWDLSTVGTPTIKIIETYGSNQVGLFISSDGRRLWTVCTSNDTVIEYSMSPWNISNLSWVQAKDISGQDSSPSAVFWSANGDRLFIAGDGDNDIVAFSIVNEWDIAGLSWFEDFGTDIDAPTGLHFSSDGRRMYVMDGSAEDDIHEFHLSLPWYISTARLVNLFDVSAENSSPQGIFLVPDNSKIFMVGTSTPDGVYGYDLGLEVDGLILADGGLTVGGVVKMNNLLTSDPSEAGVLWNSSGVVMVSAG